MRNLLLICSFLLYSGTISCQIYQWNATPSPAVSFRYEDVYFLNEDTGFAVYYSSIQPGFVTRTDNGGQSWTIVWDSIPFGFRDIAFTDDLHGWIGTYSQTGSGADTSIVYQTVDGGFTWNPETNFPGPSNAGICGLRSINDSTLYAVGRYSGPTGFYKTTNNGLSWSYVDMSSLADGLVDVFFFNADTGFVVGNVGPSYNTGFGRILYTTNGGVSWTIQHTTTHQYSLCWKISFPSRNVGYVSMQMWNSAQRYFIKTVDGGVNWQDMPYPGGPSSANAIQGIGFLNDTVGWVGGAASTFYTQDGGSSWSNYAGLVNVNRFRFIDDTLGYCAGFSIYKLNVSGVGIAEVQPERPPLNVYPNPSCDNQYIEFYVYERSQVNLTVFDMEGRVRKVLVDEFLPESNQHIVWSPNELPSGTYFYRLECNGIVTNEKFVILE